VASGRNNQSEGLGNFPSWKPNSLQCERLFETAIFGSPSGRGFPRHATSLQDYGGVGNGLSVPQRRFAHYSPRRVHRLLMRCLTAGILNRPSARTWSRPRVGASAFLIGRLLGALRSLSDNVGKHSLEYFTSYFVGVFLRRILRLGLFVLSAEGSASGGFNSSGIIAAPYVSHS
jgi:hypothetical protein